MSTPASRPSVGTRNVPAAEAIEWPPDQHTGSITAPCPNCGDLAGKPVILSTPWPSHTGSPVSANLLACAACGCGFFHPVGSADYSVEQAGSPAALAFYLQQGAGLWSITANLAGLHRPAGTRLIEIGCGFGFGLDFARRTLGWEVLGLDPSPIAAAGRAQLGLPIQSRYLMSDDPALDGQFDVVMASEVIEHVTSPPAFARTMRSVLRDGGVLVLTTPDVDAVTPATPIGQLVPLLSIGFHLVLQSKRSLRMLLAEAGFASIEIDRVGGASLMARCRRGAAAEPPPMAADRNLYRRYLSEAAATAEPASDLWFGLTARAYREAVNSADLGVAGSLWRDFSAACERRFGFDPELSRQPALDDTLDRLALREPLCLGPVLLHRAYHRMLRGEARAAVEAVFEYAAQACDRLRRGLQRIGTDDGDAEDIAWLAQAEALLCAAERGAAGVPERFATLGAAPGDAVAQRDGGGRRTDQFRRRIFVSLVNAAQYDEADHVADVVAEVETRAARENALLADGELDVLFCAAVKELQQQPATPARALELLGQLQVASEAGRAAGRTGSAVKLVTPSLEAEILALDMLGREQEAEALRSRAAVLKADEPRSRL